MKHMKHMRYLLCGLLAVCLLSAAALADVIWEPDDDFYRQHSEDCEYLGRSYYVNGPEGGAALYQNPGGGYVRVVENGVPLYISFTYTDLGGTLWGVAEYGDAGDTGWVDMADLLLIYDNQSFMEEHEAEFVPYDNSFEDLCSSENQRVLFWTYPGSGRICGDFETLHQDYSPLQPDVTWTDGDGRVWGRVGYYMAARGWVCLSEPDNEELPVTEHSYDLYPAGDLSQVGSAPGPVTLGSLWAVCGAVVLVCGVTAFLIFRMKKP